MENRAQMITGNTIHKTYDILKSVLNNNQAEAYLTR